MATPLVLSVASRLQRSDNMPSAPQLRPDLGLQAVLLLHDYLPRQKTSITPHSKRHTDAANAAAGCGCLVVAVEEQLREHGPVDAAQAVYAAAAELLGAEFRDDIDAAGLARTAALVRAELGTSHGSSGGGRERDRTTITIVAALLQELRAARFEALQHLITCVAILELMCLRHDAGPGILRQGSLLAGAVVAAAFCITAPPGSAAQGGPILLARLADLCGWPQDVMLTMANSVLAHVFP